MTSCAPSAQAALHDVVPDIPSGSHLKPPPTAHAANISYGGGPVLHFNRTYLIFWVPAGSGLSLDPGYAQQMETFLAEVAHDSHLPTNVYSLTGQYYDNGGPAAYASIYGGAILDTDPLPAPDPRCSEPPPPPVGQGPGWSECVSDQQIRAELSHVVGVHKLPAGLGNVYSVITPNGLGDCDTSALPAACALGGPANNGYCGYHDVTADGILYAVIPYNAVAGHCQSDSPRPNGSTADPAISSLSHEHNEMITDPLGDAWFTGSSLEDGDLCLNMTRNPPPVLGGSGSGSYSQVIDGGHYWLQLEWSNKEGGCAARDEFDALTVNAPRNATAGRRTRMRAHGHDPDGRISSYFWSFGDGATGHGEAPRHAYRRAGQFTIMLRSTDSDGNWAFASRRVKIKPRRRGRR